MIKMKILVCANAYKGFGIGNVVYNILDKIKEKCNITLCNTNIPNDLNSAITRIDMGNILNIKKNPLDHRIIDYLGGLCFWYKAGKYIQKNYNMYDIIWLHNPNPISFRLPLPKKALTTMHTTKHGQSSHSLFDRVVSKREKKFYYNTDCKFTAVSQQVCKELEEIGITKQRITYIPNGVNTELFKPSNNKKKLREKFGIPEDDLIILSLGRLTESKQPQKLIEVFSVIEKEMKDVTLVIAGKGELSEKTKELVRQKKLKNVIFLGYVDEKDKPDLYACSDYYIMTSKYEGQPLTLLEAMASGLPCIVSDIPNLRIVEDARCGVIVDFEDIEKAAKRIIKYLEGANLEHSRNAREYAVNNLDWSIIAGMYLNEFRKIINRVIK